MTQELFANPNPPGTVTPFATLAAAVTSTSTTTLLASNAAPAPLQATGQFRIIIDTEIMIVTSGANTGTYTVTRGAEGSTAATHLNSANIFHTVTEGSLNTFAQVANNLSDLTNEATARTNLGLGTMATANTGSFDAAGTSATETTRAEAAEALLAPKASPALSGTPTAPTATALTDSTQIATTAYTDTAVAVETARAEAAEALKAATSALTTEISRAEAAEALLAPLASPALTGAPTATTAAALTNSIRIATTAYADAAVAVETAARTSAGALLAPLASPALTGTPTAPTATTGTNTTQLATTAFVEATVGVTRAAPTSSQFSGTSYTLQISDAGNYVESTGALTAYITVPTYVSVPFPYGSGSGATGNTIVYITQMGPGGVVVQPASGVTIYFPYPGGYGGYIETFTRYATITLRQTQQNVWIVSAAPVYWW